MIGVCSMGFGRQCPVPHAGRGRNPPHWTCPDCSQTIKRHDEAALRLSGCKDRPSTCRPRAKAPPRPRTLIVSRIRKWQLSFLQTRRRLTPLTTSPCGPYSFKTARPPPSKNTQRAVPPPLRPDQPARQSSRGVAKRRGNPDRQPALCIQQRAVPVAPGPGQRALEQGDQGALEAARRGQCSAAQPAKAESWSVGQRSSQQRHWRLDL